MVLLRSDPPNRDEAAVFHVRKPEGGSLVFLAPELIRTQRGPILCLEGRGPGGGDAQYNNHEYWLWRSGGWVLLDALSWVYALRDRLPDGYSMAVWNLAPALETMTYVTEAYRGGASSARPIVDGTFTIRFVWDDLTLRVASIEHDPNAASTH